MVGRLGAGSETLGWPVVGWPESPRHHNIEFPRHHRVLLASSYIKSLRYFGKLLIAALTLVVLSFSAPTVDAKPAPKVILIVADYLTLSDVLDSSVPAVHRLVNEGGVGLICPVGNGAGPVGSGYASISAGAYCWAGSIVDKSFTSAEFLPEEPDSAGAIYKRRTGESHASPVVHLEVPLIKARNEKRMIRSAPGVLGDILAKAGKRTAVFGNSDLVDRQRRRASIITATPTGSVGFGDVSAAMLRFEPISVTGYVTDSKRLASAVDGALGHADFIVVDFGDMTRVELNKSLLSERAYTERRMEALGNLNSFFKLLEKGRAYNASIILVSMASKLPGINESRRFAPVVIRLPNGKAGSLVSSTTRTPGLISGFDIAPTVLAGLGLSQPKSVVGAPITALPGSCDNVRWLDNLVVMNRATVWPVLGVLAAIGIISVIAACFFIAFGKSGQRRIGIAIRLLLILSLVLPLAMLFATYGNPVVAGYLVRLLIWAVALVGCAFAVGAALKKLLGESVECLPKALPVIGVAIIACITLFVEACRGGRLIRFALPSTTDFRGYRFYGIGNEYMGVWLILAVVAIVWLRECYPCRRSCQQFKIAMLVISAATVLGLGMPQFGANAGGMLSAFIALGLVHISGTKGKFGIGHVAVLAVGGLGLVGALGLLDLHMSHSSPSHIGLAASMSGEPYGYEMIFATAIRKISMNLRLIGTAQSQIALIGAIPFLIIWLLSIGKKFDNLTRGRPEFRSGIMAALVGTAAAFLFNDSGIVAAGLMFSFLIVAVLYSLLEMDEGKCKV